jgi:hypothetical protein
MDVETINALTKERGDAEGFDRSGRYRIDDIDTVECPCDEVAMGELMNNDGFAGFSICLTVNQFPGASSDARVVATDGVLTVEISIADGGELVGPLNAGGDFSVGVVTTLSTAGAEGRLITRIDGDFDGRDAETTVEATLQHRIVGNNELSGEKVDCTEVIDLAGEHIQPL